MDIKSTLTEAIAEVRVDFQGLTARMAAALKAGKKRDAAIADLQMTRDQHSGQISVIQRTIEDLDDRGRAITLESGGCLRLCYLIRCRLRFVCP